MSLTSGLHWPICILTMAKTFDDFVVISVIDAFDLIGKM